MPIINMYAEKGKVKKIDALRTREEVYEDVKKALAEYLLWEEIHDGDILK